MEFPLSAFVIMALFSSSFFLISRIVFISFFIGVCVCDGVFVDYTVFVCFWQPDILLVLGLWEVTDL